MPAHPIPSMHNEETCDVLVLGAGAAGLMAAMTAGQHGRRVLVLDRADRIGKKILISGGGRCNFTNLNCTADALPLRESSLRPLRACPIHAA